MKPVTDPNLIASLEGGALNVGRGLAAVRNPIGAKPVQDPETLAMLDYGVDISGDENQVRERIRALAPDQQEGALRHWADARVAKERSGGGFVRGVGEALRSVANGAGMGFADELGAGIQGGLHAISGGNLGAPYDETLAYERAYDRAVAKDQGGLGTALNIAGSLPVAMALPVARGATAVGDIGAGAATGAGYGAVSGFGAGEGGAQNRINSAGAGAAVGGVLGGGLTAGFNGANAVRRAYANQGERGAYGAIANDLQGGVDTFADQIATGASRANVTTNRRTLDILGEEMQRANGNVPAAQAATVARISRELGVTPATAAAHIRRLSQVHEDSPLILGEYPSVSGSDAAQRLRRPANVDLDELGRLEGTPTQGKIDYLANNGNAQSAADVRNALSLRQEGMAPALRETLDTMAPRIQTGQRSSRPAAIQDTADLVETTRNLARQEYDAAYNAPVATPQRLQQLPRFFEYLSNRMATSAPDVASTIRNAVNQIAVRLPNGQLGTQSLRQMQQGRTTLRGQIEALERTGRADLANQIRPLYRLVTRVMEEMSPAWRTANRRWADMNLSQVAQELGDAFSTKAGPQFREQLATFQGLAPEAQNIVRIHVLQKLGDKLDNLGDQHSVSKLFSNDASRNLIRQLFGDEAAVGFTRAVRDQKVAEVSQNMLRNSATHRRGVAQKQMDAETGLVSAVENANARGVRNWLLERATQLLTERRNRPMADILTTPMSDTARVAQHVHNMRTQQQNLARFDQRPALQDPAIISASSKAGQGVAPLVGTSEDNRKKPGQRPPGMMRLGGPKPIERQNQLMQDAATTASWDNPDQKRHWLAQGLENLSNIHSPTPQEAQSFVRSGLASLLDFGGASSDLLRRYGGEGGAKAANRLEELKSESGAGEFIGGANPSALPGALKDVVEGLSETANPEPGIKVQSRDEFFQSRRKARPSLEEAVANAEREARDSSGVKSMIDQGMGKNARKAVAEAGERAKSAWYEGQKNVGSEEKQIEADYQAYLADINKQLEKEHSKGFSERNPWFKTAVGLGSLASAGMATAFVGRLAKKGDKLLDALMEARKAGDPQRVVRAEKALNAWKDSLLKKQALAVGGSATIPMDMRGIADVVDAYGTPQTYFDANGEAQPARANAQAREHLEPMNFLADSLPALMSGLIGAGLGAKFSRSAPVEKAQAATAKLTKRDLAKVSRDEIASILEANKISQARAELEMSNLARERLLAKSRKALHRQYPRP